MFYAIAKCQNFIKSFIFTFLFLKNIMAFSVQNKIEQTVSNFVVISFQPKSCVAE